MNKLSKRIGLFDMIGLRTNIGIALILLFVVTGAVVLAQNVGPGKPLSYLSASAATKIQEVNTINVQLINQNNLTQCKGSLIKRLLNKCKQISQAELEARAIQRQQDLKDIAQLDPQTLLNSNNKLTLSQGDLPNLPAAVQNSVEQQAALTGSLRRVNNSQTSKSTSYLLTADGASGNKGIVIQVVVPTQLTPPIPDNTVVTVSGILIGGNPSGTQTSSNPVLVASPQSIVSSQSTSGTTVGTRRVAVVVNNMAGYPGAALDHVKAFFQRVSYGNLNLDFTPVITDIPQEGCMNWDTFPSWTQKVGKPAGFDNYIYIISRPPCSDSILSVPFFGGNETWVSPSYFSITIGIIQGLSYNWGIGANPMPPLGENPDKFIDHYDFSAGNKRIVGWLNDSDIQTVSGNGVYSLAPYQASTGTRALVIPGRCLSMIPGDAPGDLYVQLDKGLTAQNELLALANRATLYCQFVLDQSKLNVHIVGNNGWRATDVPSWGVWYYGLSVAVAPGDKVQVLFAQDIGDYTGYGGYNGWVCNINYHANSQNKCVPDSAGWGDSAPGNPTPTYPTPYPSPSSPYPTPSYSTPPPGSAQISCDPAAPTGDLAGIVCQQGADSTILHLSASTPIIKPDKITIWVNNQVVSNACLNVNSCEADYTFAAGQTSASVYILVRKNGVIRGEYSTTARRQ